MFDTDIYCLENEIWKDIPTYEGLYQASSLGRIRSIDGKLTHTDRHGLRKWKGRILKNKTKTPGNEGYKVSLWKSGTHIDWLAHRLVCMTFYGLPDTTKKGSERITVNHKDGNRHNNKIENLEWLSVKENIQHGFRTGLFASSQKRTCLVFNDGKSIIFNSMSEASRYLNKTNGYISGCLIKNHKIYDSNKNEVQAFLSF
jgi:hypothetical protein